MMNWLVRLYPPSWRRRYGAELEDLVQQMPGRTGTALDLVVGAAIAYRDVIHSNRVLSAAAAYLHGLCVAVLLQAIVFLTMIMSAQGTGVTTKFRLGPVELATFTPAAVYGRLSNVVLAPALLSQTVGPWVPEVVSLATLAVLLALVLAAPRLLRSLR